MNSIRQRLELPVRRAGDDNLYTLEEYVTYYGEDLGTWKWEVNAQVLLRCSCVVMLEDKTHLLQVSDEPLAAIALEYADAKLKADKRIVMAAVCQHGKVLQCADWKLKEDSEVVMAAVSNWPDALFYADDKLKADRNIVMAAVSKDGNSLLEADATLRVDRDVVKVAVS